LKYGVAPLIIFSAAATASATGCRASARQRPEQTLTVTPKKCTLATSAPDPLLIDGTLLDFSGGEKRVAGGVVEARTRDGVTVASNLTDAAGKFSLSIPTGGKPFTGRLRAIKEGLVPTNYEVVGGYNHNMSGWRQELVDDKAFVESAAAEGLTRTAIDSIVGVKVQECGSLAPARGLGGVSVSIPEGAAVAYTADEGTRAASTSDSIGLAWSYKVTAGEIHILTTKDGVTSSFATRVDPGEELFVFDYL
jgi:hypothetical protein